MLTFPSQKKKTDQVSSSLHLPKKTIITKLFFLSILATLAKIKVDIASRMSKRGKSKKGASVPAAPKAPMMTRRARRAQQQRMDQSQDDSKFMEPTAPSVASIAVKATRVQILIQIRMNQKIMKLVIFLFLFVSNLVGKGLNGKGLALARPPKRGRDQNDIDYYDIVPEFAAMAAANRQARAV